MKPKQSTAGQLSPAGQQRRAGILEAMLAESTRVHRSRRIRRRVGLSLALVVACGLIFQLPNRFDSAPRTSPTSSQLTERSVSADSIEATSRAMITTFRSTGQDRSDYMVLTPSTHTRVEVLDDARLLDELAAIERAAGIIRSGDEVHLYLASRGD